MFTQVGNDRAKRKSLTFDHIIVIIIIVIRSTALHT